MGELSMVRLRSLLEQYSNEHLSDGSELKIAAQTIVLDISNRLWKASEQS